MWGFKKKKKESSPESVKLYQALRKRDVPAELEKWDGYKHIDIAIVEAKINIEVDGNHHAYNHKQALADLKRTYYSFRKGYITLHLPNLLIKERLDETCDLIVGILNESNVKLEKENSKVIMYKGRKNERFNR